MQKALLCLFAVCLFAAPRSLASEAPRPGAGVCGRSALSSRLEAATKVLSAQRNRGLDSILSYLFATDPESGLLPLEIEIVTDTSAPDVVSWKISFYVRPSPDSPERIQLMHLAYRPGYELSIIEVYFELKKKHPELMARGNVGHTMKQGIFFLLENVCTEPGLVLRVHGTPNLKLLALLRGFMTDIGVYDYPKHENRLDMSSRRWFASGFLDDMFLSLLDDATGQRADVVVSHPHHLLGRGAHVLVRYGWQTESMVMECSVDETENEIAFIAHGSGAKLLSFDKRNFHVSFSPMPRARVINFVTGTRMHALEGVPHVPRIPSVDVHGRWRIVSEAELSACA